jgi:hypothetical protein
MEQDFATSVDVLLKYIDIERPSAERGLSLVRPWLARDGLVGPAERQVVVTTAREAFQIEEELDPEQIFDFGPLEAAARAVDASGWKP